MAGISEKDHTRYEKTRIIGARALQLSMGAPMMITFSEKELEEMSYDVLEIAKKEYEQGKIPMEIHRIMPEHHRPSVQPKEPTPAE